MQPAKATATATDPKVIVPGIMFLVLVKRAAALRARGEARGE